MGVKKIPLRLYRQHDMDLIVLYKNPQFGFHKALRLALHSYASGRPFLFSAPGLEEFGEDREIKYAYRIFLQLDEDRDQGILELFDRVKPKNRNAFVKSVIRGSMIGPYAYGCMIKGDECKEAAKILALSLSEFVNGTVSEPPEKRVGRNKNSPTSPKKMKKFKTEEKGKKISDSEEKAGFDRKHRKKDEPKVTDIKFEQEAEPETLDANDFFAELNGLLGANMR